MPRTTPSAGGASTLSLAHVLRAALSRQTHPRLPIHHWRVLRAIFACRTPTLGGHHYRCAACGHDHFVPHSCRNRHCPTCQGANGAKWMQKQAEALLPVPYFHLVFTLPHTLNPLIAQNQAALYRLLFDAASETLLAFGRGKFRAQLGITAVLHTWSQTLLDHYHLHCIVTGGGLRDDGSAWVPTKPHWLFPIRALSQVFRAKYRDGLRALLAAGKLHFRGQLARLAQPTEFARLIQTACREPWVVYAKRPFAEPQTVLAYLARYTHRVGITNQRLHRLDTDAGTVSFAYKDYADCGRRKRMTLDLDEFLRRFRLHILPPRFVKIRHYGFLSTRNRHTRVAEARSLLAAESKTLRSAQPMPAPILAATPLTCPHCSQPTLVLIRITHPPLAPLPVLCDSS